MDLRSVIYCFFFQAEDGIRDIGVTGVQTCALPISPCITPRTASEIIWSLAEEAKVNEVPIEPPMFAPTSLRALDRKSTRLNSSHANISYAVFCLKKK